VRLEPLGFRRQARLLIGKCRLEGTSELSCCTRPVALL
jgi:hypothetical protein